MIKTLRKSSKRVLQESGKNLSDSGKSVLRPEYTIQQTDVHLTARTPVRVQYVAVDGAVRPHNHDYFEICIMRAGRAAHRTGAGRAAFAAGGVTVLAPGDVHAFEDVRSLEAANFYYLTEWLLGEVRSLWDQDGLIPLFLARSLFRLPAGAPVPQWTLTDRESELCAHETAALDEEARAATPSLMYLKSAFLKLLVVLSRAYVRSITGEMGMGFRREVWLGLDYLEACVAESAAFSLEEMGRCAGMSAGHAARLFRAATGRAPQEYFQRRRAQRAGLLLLDPAKSITEVAYAAGYADAAHFSRTFRAHFGLSPRQYRQRYGGGAGEGRFRPRPGHV